MARLLLYITSAGFVKNVYTDQRNLFSLQNATSSPVCSRKKSNRLYPTDHIFHRGEQDKLVEA